MFKYAVKHGYMELTLKTKLTTKSILFPKFSLYFKLVDTKKSRLN